MTAGSAAIETSGRRVPIRDIARVRMGKTILAKELATSGVPVYSAGTGNEPWGFVADSDLLFGDETLVISARGNIGMPKMPRQAPFVCTQTTIAISLVDARLRKYLYYYLQSINFSSLTSQTTIPMIRVSDVNEIKVPCPDQAERDRIVAEIERQFSRLDEAVANLKRVKANLERYKAAALKAAVEGRLVPTEAELARQEQRGYESGEQLLRRILELRRKSWEGRGRYKEPVPPKTEWQYPLPDGWVWTTLGHLAFSVKDGPHYSPKYADEGIPFISGGNVRPEGIDFSTAKFIAPGLHVELSRRCKPEFGNLLYTKGGTTGIARVNTEHRDFNVWVHVAVLKLAADVHPFYIQHALNSKHCYRQSQLYTHGVGNQDLGLTRMVWITVPLPPRAEQGRIVAEVDRRLSVVAEIEAEVSNNLARATVLRSAVLSAAFTGTV